MTTTLTEAAKLAIAALERTHDIAEGATQRFDAADALRAALATQEALPAVGEPVAWQVKQKVYKDRGPWVDVDRTTYESAAKYPDRCEVRALYTASPVQAPASVAPDDEVELIAKHIEEHWRLAERDPRDIAKEIRVLIRYYRSVK